MVFLWKSHAAMLVAAALACATGGAAEAGQLILNNTSGRAIDCTVDGWSSRPGTAALSRTLTVPANRSQYISPALPVQTGGAAKANANKPADAPTIRWVQCGALRIEPLNITADGPDIQLTLTGLQTRVLNVSLYPYVPNIPGRDFSTLIAHVTSLYQSQNPQVLLNASMTETTDIYDFTNLAKLLSKGGFDVMEIDMLYLSYLANYAGGPLINPARPVGDPALPIATLAASVGGMLWAVPSWLCMDFIYSRNPAIQKVNSVQSLTTFLRTNPPPVPYMAADFNGSWRMPSIYTNAYMQTYGYSAGNVTKSQTMPPDQMAMASLSNLLNLCFDAASSLNPCGNGTYHKATPGKLEEGFALGLTATAVGFSEQSFYINLAQAGPLFVAPMPWANRAQPLLFADGFVTNSFTCATGTPCAGDADKLIALMTSSDMKAYIVESKDLPANLPWRTLLVATAPFYQRPEIANHSLYNQYRKVFATAQPFPNQFTDTVKTGMDNNICAALKQSVGGYSC